MTSRGVTFLLELRNLSKLSMHLGLVNFWHFYPDFPWMAPICGQRYLCSSCKSVRRQRNVRQDNTWTGWALCLWTYMKLIGVRAGGGRGGLQPPQILGNSDFLGSKRKFGQSQFSKTFPCFFISLKREIFSILIWKNPEVSVIIQLLSLETLTVVS